MTESVAMLINEWCHCVVSAESKWETCSHFIWAFELLHHLSRRKLVFKNCLMSSFCPFCWKNEIMETLLHFLLSLSGAVCGNSVITQPVFDPHSGICPVHSFTRHHLVIFALTSWFGCCLYLYLFDCNCLIWFQVERASCLLSMT